MCSGFLQHLDPLDVVWAEKIEPTGLRDDRKAVYDKERATIVATNSDDDPMIAAALHVGAGKASDE
jgi:hypothetical protein